MSHKVHLHAPMSRISLWERWYHFNLDTMWHKRYKVRVKVDMNKIEKLITKIDACYELEIKFLKIFFIVMSAWIIILHLYRKLTCHISSINIKGLLFGVNRELYPYPCSPLGFFAEAMVMLLSLVMTHLKNIG